MRRATPPARCLWPDGKGLLALAGLCAVVAGCAVISPPAMTFRHDDPAPGTVGDVRIVVAIGLAGGVFLDGGAGAEVKISGQMTPGLEVGGGVSAGLNLEHDAAERAEGGESASHAELVYGVRSFARGTFRDHEWTALEGGLGVAGSDRGLLALTLDGGAQFGYALPLGDADPDSDLVIYGGPLFGVSVPVRDGQPVREKQVLLGMAPDQQSVATWEDHWPKTTWFVGANWGSGVLSRSAERAGGTLEAVLLFAYSEDDGAALLGVSAAGAGTVPSGE